MSAGGALTLLPVAGLDLSLTVVILVGVLFLLFLSETLGWSFGGLIVPGYLGSIFAISPAAGWTISGEALAAFAITWLLSEGLGRAGAWTPFFGRDRFLMVVLVSVIVRQQCETWLLPEVLAAVNASSRQGLIPVEEAHSVGLVLVPLVANALWKTSPSRGLLQVAAPTLLSWVALDRVLLSSTNLSLGWMALAYEDPALDFLGSARAYVILLTGAIFASRFMLSFGWNAGGILIPALLGLAYLEPGRLLATGVETVVLVFAYRALVALPGARRLNLEGGRRLALLFGLAVALRVAASWAHARGAPIPAGVEARFGYLLSSLLAAKILQFRSFGTVMLPAAFTSALAFLGGTGAVWAIEQGLPPAPVARAAPGERSGSRLLRTPEGMMTWARLRARLDAIRPPAVSRPAGEREAWARLVQASAEAAARGTLDGITAALPPGISLRPGPSIGERPSFILAESEDHPDALIGWGALVLRPGGLGPALLVEHPWTQGPAAEAAIGRCAATDCRLIAIAGLDAARPGPGWDRVRAAFGAPAPAASTSPPAAEDARAPSDRGLLAWLEAAVEGASGIWTPAPVDALALSEVVVPALAAAATGQGSEAEALRAASLLGLPLTRVDDTLVLGPGEAGPLIVVGVGARAPVLIAVPNPREELGTLAIGLSLFRTLRATALVVDPTPGPSPGGGLVSLGHVAHLAVRPLVTRQPGALTLMVRGLGPSAPATLREDLVVGVGLPMLADPPPELARLFGEGGPLRGRWTLRWARGAPDELGLTGAEIPSVLTDRMLGGCQPAVLWFSAEARESWASPDRAAVADWLSGAGLSLEDRDAAAPVAGGSPSPETRGALAPLASLLSRARSQQNVNLARAAVTAARQTPGAALSAGWDDARGYAFFELSLARGAGVARLRMPLVQGPLRESPVDFGDEAALSAALDGGPATLIGVAR